MIKIIMKLLLLTAILATPSLSFGQTPVCSGLYLNGSVSLPEPTPAQIAGGGSTEVATFYCEGVVFVGVPTNGGAASYAFGDDVNGIISISDQLDIENPVGGSPALITFYSYGEDLCGTSPCAEGTETPPHSVLATFNGTPVTFTFGSDPFIDPNQHGSDFISVAAVSQTPEPATFTTFGTGLLALAGFLRRKLHT